MSADPLSSRSAPREWTHAEAMDALSAAAHRQAREREAQLVECPNVCIEWLNDREDTSV